jgi:hypothetical protein
MNIDEVNKVRKLEIPTAKPLAPEPRFNEPEIAIKKLQHYKSPGLM